MNEKSLNFYGKARGITREYSIRKIFGASSAILFYSSTMGHLRHVMIATIIAVPVGYYFSDKSLNSFAYDTSLTLLPFLIAGILAGLLAFITVGSQVIKVVFAGRV